MTADDLNDPEVNSDRRVKRYFFVYWRTSAFLPCNFFHDTFKASFQLYLTVVIKKRKGHLNFPRIWGEELWFHKYNDKNLLHCETLIKDVVSASSADDHLETLSERPAGYMKATAQMKEMPEGLPIWKIIICLAIKSN